MSADSQFEPDLEDLRRLGYQLVDRFVEATAAEAEDPVLPDVTAEQLAERFSAGLPRTGASRSSVVEEMLELLQGSVRRNGHPGFMGYVSSSAEPIGVLADFWTSTLNQNVTAWRSAPGATSLELQVVRWLSEFVGFGSEHGLLTSGGSMANGVGLAASLQALARQKGVKRSELLERATLHVSSETHLSVVKAFSLQGGRAENVRSVATDDERRMSLDALQESIERDLAAGLFPACVVGSLGTANTGTIDPLAGIADLCEQHRIWMHVDGAYGAPAVSLPTFEEERSAMARASSLSMDPHKWLFCPIDVGCVLVRDRAVTEEAFRFDSAYTTDPDEENLERFAFFEHGVEMSRRARALKVWAVLKTHGSEGLAREIAREIGLREWFDREVKAHAHLEHLGSGLSISCFRFRSRHSGHSNQLNERLLTLLNHERSYFLSPTNLEGRFTLRICIVNFRTQREHLARLIQDVVRIGVELDQESC